MISALSPHLPAGLWGHSQGGLWAGHSVYQTGSETPPFLGCWGRGSHKGPGTPHQPLPTHRCPGPRPSCSSSPGSSNVSLESSPLPPSWAEPSAYITEHPGEKHRPPPAPPSREPRPTDRGLCSDSRGLGCGGRGRWCLEPCTGPWEEDKHWERLPGTGVGPGAAQQAPASSTPRCPGHAEPSGCYK